MPFCRLAVRCACLGLALAFSGQARAAGAMEAVAQEAAQSLAQTPASSVVVAAPVASDQPAPRGRRARAANRRARRRPHWRRRPRARPPAQLATARAIAGRASALVFVQAEIAKGDLRLTIDVYPSMANAWDRIRNPLPAPSSHAFASAKIDAEVRSFMTPLVLEHADVHRAHHDEGDVLAAACGDVDGDGGNETRPRLAGTRRGGARARWQVRRGTGGGVERARRAHARSDARDACGRGRHAGRGRRRLDRSRGRGADRRARPPRAVERRPRAGRRRPRVPDSAALRRRVRRGPARVHGGA